VAIGFVLAGLSIIDRASVLRFSFYIVLAVLFHKSALIVLPLVALATTRKKIVIVPVLAATAVLLYYLFVSESMDRLMENYVEADQNSQGAAIRAAMNVPPALLYLLLWKRFGLNEEQQKLWRNFAYASLLAVVILVVTSASTAVDRLALYLIPIQIFVFTRLPEALEGRGRGGGAIVLLVVAYSALIQFVWLTFANHAGFWLPYQIYPFGEG
jgi:hypothetical protein